MEMSNGHLSPLDAALFSNIFRFLTLEIKTKDLIEKRSQWLAKAEDFHAKLQRFRLQELTQNQLSPMDMNFIIYAIKFLNIELPQKIVEEKQNIQG